MIHERDLERLIASSGAKLVAVSVRDLVTGEAVDVCSSESFHAASTMKLCVLVELFRAAHAGELSIDEQIEVRNRFASIVDGSSFVLTPADDSESSLYDRLGESESLLGLAKPMITHSSNLATNLLMDRLGAEAVSKCMRDLGFPGLEVLRGVEDGKAFDKGLNNRVTASELTGLLAQLTQSRVVSPEASQSMIEILLAQTHRGCIPAGLPVGTPVANKPGWNSVVCHDCAIVFALAGNPYALTVLTEGLDETKDGPAFIAEVSRRIYEGRSVE